MSAGARRTDWAAAAGRLAESLPRGRLHPAVVAWAEARPPREPWAVAFSGGADSLCLLLLVWAHWPERRARLRALHFDHRLRGAASRADAAFCSRVCGALGVPIVAGARAAGRRPHSETTARAARFTFFDGAMGRRRIRTLWLGHQQDDIAESMLMRLARGSGAAGLAAPRPVHAMPRGRIHLRPLMTLGKKTIAAALRAAGAVWRDDATNAEAGPFRNRLRLQVIPRWIRASGRDAAAGAALARELLEEDDRAIESRVDELRPIGADGSLELGRVAGMPRAVVRRALHRWLLAHDREGTLSRQGFEGLLAAVERGTPVRHSLGAEGFAAIRRGRLHFVSLH